MNALKRQDYQNKYSIVADIYDTYVNTDYDIRFWLDECRAAKEVLEITCGTGRITIPLAQAGIKITALDISKELLEKLKKKCSDLKLVVKIHQEDMRSFNLGRKFPLIIIPFQSIQELVNPEDHEATFKAVHKHMEDCGRFIVTTHNAPLVTSEMSQLKKFGEYIHPLTNNRLVFSMSRSTDAETHTGIAYQVYEEFDSLGRIVSKKEFKNRHYIFGKGEFEDLAGKTDFRIVEVFGDYGHSPVSEKSPFRIFVLVKK